MIRFSWFNGDSVANIESICNNAKKIRSDYYGYHFPWIINATAKKNEITK